MVQCKVMESNVCRTMEVQVSWHCFYVLDSVAEGRVIWVDVVQVMVFFDLLANVPIYSLEFGDFFLLFKDLLSLLLLMLPFVLALCCPAACLPWFLALLLLLFLP